MTNPGLFQAWNSGRQMNPVGEALVSTIQSAGELMTCGVAGFRIRFIGNHGETALKEL